MGMSLFLGWWKYSGKSKTEVLKKCWGKEWGGVSGGDNFTENEEGWEVRREEWVNRSEPVAEIP